MEFTAYDIALVPVIIAFISVLGHIGLSARWKPLVAIILGLAAGFIYIAPDNPAQAVLVGLVMGLTSIGAYSGTRNTFQKRQ